MNHARNHPAIVGAGLTRFDSYDNDTVEDIARPAVVAALRDAAIDRRDIQAAFVSHLWQGEVLGQRILRGLGFRQIPVVNMENACAAGSSAVQSACLAISAGQYDCVLVLGAEKMGRGLINFASTDSELALGNIAPAQYALAAQRHMHEFGTPAEAFAQIAVKNRGHAALNPNARFRDRVTAQEVLNSRRIADPLTLLQCCRNGSGAAALVIVSAARARQMAASRPVSVLGGGMASWMFDNSQQDLTSFGGTRAAAAAAYEQAGVGPDDVDLVELHDAFTVGELLHCEGLGLCDKGHGAELVMSGATALGGRVPVNVSGGLLSKSHPPGATGVAQFCELTWQLRGEAAGRQVQGARVALAHSQGGTGLQAGATCVTLLGV